MNYNLNTAFNKLLHSRNKKLKAYLKQFKMVIRIYIFSQKINLKFASSLFDLKIKFQLFKCRKKIYYQSSLVITNSNLNKTLAYQGIVDSELPKLLKLHRRYFSRFGRGYGEEIFHLMWLELFYKYKPRKILEIGVYRGQTISLFSLLCEKMLNSSNFQVHGLSPFSNLGDSVSNYPELNYLKDCLKNLKFFQCRNVFLHQLLSTEPEAINLIRNGSWDIIYIDGSHEFDIVKQDFENALIGLSEDGLIVLDDSSLYLSHPNDTGRFWGHPGPSRIAKEFASSKLRHVASVGHNNVYKKL
jgi:hypothetical protein